MMSYVVVVYVIFLASLVAIFMILFRQKDYKIEIEMQLNDIKKMIEDLASKEQLSIQKR